MPLRLVRCNLHSVSASRRCDSFNLAVATANATSLTGALLPAAPSEVFFIELLFPGRWFELVTLGECDFQGLSDRACQCWVAAMLARSAPSSK